MKKFLIIFIFFVTSSYAELIKNIEINGNIRISNETISVFTKVNSGDDLKQNDLNEILNRLYDTNFFKDVKINFLKASFL